MSMMMTETQPIRGCLWPMWPHNTRPTHEFCNHRRAPGSSYCEAHRQMSVRSSETEPETRFVPRRKAA